MIRSTSRRPAMARKLPDSTSWVKRSMSPCWSRKRCAAARMFSSVPPTLMTATPSRSTFTPVCDTAPSMLTLMRRLDRSSECSFCTNGSTNTLAPVTTFCADRSA
jgi:hypothetical protein